MQARSLRRIAALVAVLLAGVILQPTALLAGTEAAPATASGAGATIARLAAATIDVAGPGTVDAPSGPGDDVAGEDATRLIVPGLDAVGAAAVVGRSSGSSWAQAMARTACAALGIVAAAAALLANRPRRPVLAWCLVRPDRTRATARHRSPLAARRAPPAPACS